MTKKVQLTKNITENGFDNGYWYAKEIKAFAKEIGIKNSIKLRKDELEQLIKHYIRTGQVKKSDRKNIVKSVRKAFSSSGRSAEIIHVWLFKPDQNIPKA